MDRGKGCTAGNRHLAGISGIRPDSAGKVVAQLAARDLIKIHIEKRGTDRGTSRTIHRARPHGLQPVTQTGYSANPHGLQPGDHTGYSAGQESNIRKENENVSVKGFDTNTDFFEKNFPNPDADQNPSPGSARPLPFADVFGKAFEIAVFRCIEYDRRNAGLNVGHYVRKAANWSAAGGKTSLDWPATISTFIENDRAKNALQKRDSIAAPPHIVEAVTIAAQHVNLRTPPFADFRRRVSFLAENYAPAVVAGFAAEDPERAAAAIAALDANPERAAEYFQKGQKS